MNKFCKVSLMGIFSILLISCGQNTPKVDEYNYYFDSSNIEEGDGSEGNPYRSLSVLESLSFDAPTNIYLKKGATFNESLTLRNVGNDGSEILVTSYGKGSKMPIINAPALSDTRQSSVLLYNCSNVTVANLEITEQSSEQGNRIGVCIESSSNGELTTYSNITIKGNYIHDIHGHTGDLDRGMDDPTSKKTGGIIVLCDTYNVKYDSLVIKKNKIERCDLEGIATYKGTDLNVYDEKFKTLGHTNVLIDGNEISYIAKNAIFARGLSGGIISNNVITETAIKAHAGNTIVTSNVNGTIIEHNEGSFNRANTDDGSSYQDGCMLDADLNSPNTIWQYNYSHDNSFGLFLNCNYKSGSANTLALNDRMTVRFNISYNDFGNKGIFYVNYACRALFIHNNTIITRPDTKYIFMSNTGNKGKTYYFKNNLIYNRSSAALFSYAGANDTDAEFEYNLVYNEPTASIDYGNGSFDEDNINGIFGVDPRFIYDLPTTKGSYDGFSGKKLGKVKQGSVVLNNGIYESDLLNYVDIYGNEYEKPCIGCCAQGYVS